MSGPLAEVAAAVGRTVEGEDADPFLVFNDASGEVVDLDLRDARSAAAPSPPSEAMPRGRGRPRLGVVAREVTLLPRHWEWLSAQPGGASVALRKLVEEARRTSGDRDRSRQAKEAAYRFMSAMAGNFAGFEEACRALFADNSRRFAELVAPWPPDIRDYAVKLAFANRVARR